MTSDGQTVTIGAASVGSYGDFTVGQQLLFHVTGCLNTNTSDLGKYGVATISAVNGAQLTLNAPVPYVNLSNYVCQVVSIPQFTNLTLSTSLYALSYNDTNKYGGIIILKCSGTLDLSSGGRLLAQSKGLPGSRKPAGVTQSNADLSSKLIMGGNGGSGIVIVVANVTKLSITSRLGATWTGNAGAGTGGGGNANGTTGGTGHGGSIPGGLQGYGGSGIHYYSRPGTSGSVILLISLTITNFFLDCFSTGGGNGMDEPGTSVASTPGGAGYGGGGGQDNGYSESGDSGGGAGAGFIATNTALTKNSIAYYLDNIICFPQQAIGGF